MARFLDEGVHVLPQVLAARDGDRPDVLLGDIGAYPARVFAHRWGRPLVQLLPTYVAWEGYERDMAEVLDGLRAVPGYADYHQRFGALLAEQGVPLDVDAWAGALDQVAARRPELVAAGRERARSFTAAMSGAALAAAYRLAVERGTP